ncbi:tyrosine-protein phosphatase, partial [Kitasatospora sp. NPDC057198]|uniref:tyrosine-protein phosphatase n=1 Tax=Kitasatospora sp. NPDC057198 TaxID=3346046 RepID=UPI00363BDCC3
SPESPGFPGVRNFRDAGGTGALPHGVSYRSGAPNRLVPVGTRPPHGLGVRTVLDLRSAPAVAARPDALGAVASGTRTSRSSPRDADRRSRPSCARRRADSTGGLDGRPAVAAVRQLPTAERRAGVVVAPLRSPLGVPEHGVTAELTALHTAFHPLPEVAAGR